MDALIIRLRLLEPLLATQPQTGEPNSSVSLNYIAGSMVRGAAAGAHLAQLDAQAAQLPAEEAPAWRAAAQAEFRRLFLGGALRFLHAYLEGSDPGTRMLPRPLSWFVEKEQIKQAKGAVWDAAFGPLPLQNAKLPAFTSAFVRDTYVEMTSPARQAAVHNAGENRNRKQEGDSQVFRYEALARGQTFVAVVLGDHADLAKVAPALGAIARLGGSRSGGYGAVEVLSVEEQAEWMEYHPAGLHAPSHNVVVTLVSDAILRTAAGQVGAALDEFLHDQWQLPAPTAVFQRLCLVGGFNRTAGLPLPQAWAVAAGSVLVYPRTPAVMAALTPLVASGVGERIVEGYGRLAVDWQPGAELTQQQWIPALAAAPAITLSAESHATAALMARRQLAARLDESLVQQISGLLPGLQHLPSPAQLARAQEAARRAYAAADPRIIVEHLDKLKLARREWEAATIHGQSLLDWIRAQAALQENDFVQQFGLVDRLPDVAGVTPELDAAVRARAIARLLEGVLHQAARKQKQARFA